MKELYVGYIALSIELILSALHFAKWYFDE